MDAARAIPTWMAGQAKIVAVYDEPHWRKAGLSGEGMSQQGPMVEIHDASPVDGGPYALFGFVGVPPNIRARHHDEVVALALKQLQAMFGPDMAHPLSIRMMDWAQVPQIAAPLDQAPSGHHPAYGLPLALSDLWDKALIFGSTETAQDFGGYLEGALEAAERVADRLKGEQVD
jgi:monoamine oxidase